MLVVVLANTCDCSFLEVDMAGIKVQGQVALHSKTLSKKVSEVCGECETSTMSHICLVMNIADYCAIDPMTRILLHSLCKVEFLCRSYGKPIASQTSEILLILYLDNNIMY
jgi:hypothetical protein